MQNPTLDLSSIGISVDSVHRNLAPAKLYEASLAHEQGAAISSAGALIAYSGEKTGRSPNDKRLVETDASKDDIWWGKVNVPLSPESHGAVKAQAVSHLNAKPRLYVMDGFAGHDEKYRIKVRVITSRPYHALFMHNMLIRPSQDELATFGEPDYVIYNAGDADADNSIDGVTSKTCVSLSLDHGEIVILGTEYAGEMKKGVFTVMNYLMPKAGHLSMHCSATVETKGDKSAILFGLSGTGKTTLSADPTRELVGDDEHVWTDDGIFNIEGGCYAKAIDLSRDREPAIFDALRFGAVLENVKYNDNHEVDYTDVSITQNTRGCYPIEHIDNARIPCVAGQPTDIIFLTCDAFGVLPPVAKLTPEQAMYHFISGYTAKVAGTEVGVTEPEATFSACFGAPFMVWHPTKYAELLAKKIAEQNVNVWLVNTGWSGGAYGVGQRIRLRYSRSIVRAIYEQRLLNSPTKTDPVFGFEIVLNCPDVPGEVMEPRELWSNKSAYDVQAKKLANMFVDNFKAYASEADDAVLAAAPKFTD